MPLATEPRLASALRVSVLRLSRRMRQERSNGLTATQIATLATVERHGPLTPSDLASHERVSPPSMTRVVASLAALSLVERRADPSDGRQVLVDISPEGRALLSADRRRRDEWLAARLRELDPDDRALLSAAIPVLERLAGA